MVLGRNEKRKRKEGDLVDLVDPLSATPKRAKVHAQRKFAQGAVTMFNSSQNIIKEKEKPKPTMITELITHQRPNTEDFLTFLCFRGTSILPPSLNFFSAGVKKERSQTNSPSLSSTSSLSSSSISLLLSTTNKKNNNNNNTNSNNNNTSSTNNNNQPEENLESKTNLKNNPSEINKTKITTKIKKNVDKYKITTSAIQALKKKYQEQRLAKQRIGNKLKTPCVIRTRSTAARSIIKSSKKLTPRKFLSRIQSKKRHGLRSNSSSSSNSINSANAVGNNVAKKSQKIVIPKKKKVVNNKTKKKTTESSSELGSSSESSSEEYVKSNSKSTIVQSKKSVKVIKKKICTRSNSSAKRVTRSNSEVANNSKALNQRPTRKTKEAAAVYMEILSRKLVSPDLEIDENLSSDSFPELPNVKKSLKTENDIKTKVQKLKKVSAEKKSKSKDKSNESCEKSLDKSKSSDKISLRNKKVTKILKYSDSEEEENSISSVESNKTKPVTRRSSNKSVNKNNIRSLRSSVKKRIPRSTGQSKINNKNKNSNSNSNNNKMWMKRKHKSKVNSPSENTKKDSKEKDIKKEKIEPDKSIDSPSQSNKAKRKKTNPETTEKSITLNDKNSAKVNDFPKISDDEESFRGFDTKTISKIKNNLSSSESNNINTDSNSNSNLLKPKETVENFKSKAEVIGLVMPNKFNKSEEESIKVDNESKETYPKTETSNKCNHLIAGIDIPPAIGRKERVNMSTEQIEKWLNESSMVKEESQAEMETVSNFTFEVLNKSKPSDINHLSIPARIQHLIRPVNIAMNKLADKTIAKESIRTNFHLIKSNLNVSPSKDSFNSPSATTSTSIVTAKVNTITNRNKINADIKEIIKGRSNKSEVLDDNNSNDNNKVNNCKSKDENCDKNSPEKKGGSVQQRKAFVSKVKERKNITPSVNAFSPENESSVYAFESDTEAPISTPFRRKQRDNKISQSLDLTNVSSSCNDDEDNDNDNSDSVNNCYNKKSPKSKEKHLNDCKKVDEVDNLNKCEKNNENKFHILPIEKNVSIWNNVNCSASIAVQVNFDEQNDNDKVKTVADNDNDDGINQQQKSTEISTQTESSNVNDGEDENDNDSHVFYIPLQTASRSFSNSNLNSNSLIQGVTVKLGTEGPTGPNQRVLLRAQLVTKPPLTNHVNRCPPIGTVQPTTRSQPPNPTIHSDSKSTSTQIDSLNLIKNVEDKRPTSNISDSKLQREKNVKKINSSKSKCKNNEMMSISTCTNSNSSFSNATDTACYSGEDRSEKAKLVNAPTFYPSEKDFQDPLEYIDKIRSVAEKYGICRVVPPSNFKPECKVSDDMRFTAYNQYIHRMLHRWGPNVKEMMAIKKYLATQSITLNQPPCIGGMEIDLPHLYQIVQNLGGLKEVIEKKKWQKVADGMKIPKSAQDRVTKLDDIYCKYLLPYDTLSIEEREKLFDQVEEEWKEREKKALKRLDSSLADESDEKNKNNDDEEEDEDDDDDEDNEDEDEDDDESSSDEIEECIVKGKNMPLNAFYRIARNTHRMWFGENQNSINETEGASANEVENVFWKHVSERKRHVCVHSASIDSSGRGFGFSVAKNSPFARHPWNLKVLTNNSGSVLRALGPLMGVTIPTLHVGMLFSTCCWYRDPHGLPWIEYLHTGAKKIWYGISDEHNNNFREALSKMVPRFCKNKTIWLPSDTAMVPPEMLVQNGVPLCQIVQEPGQFIIVFPKAFTSSICTGYVVSESVYFAQPTWLNNAEQIFKDLQDSCEPSMFSFERLLFSIINDTKSHVDVLRQILPAVTKIREKELNYRKQLEQNGLTNKERLPLPGSTKRRKGQKVKEESDFECETCRTSLFVSLINNSQDDSNYCLPHGLKLIIRKKNFLKNCTFKYTYSEDELDDLINKLKDKIEAKSKKTNQTRQSKDCM